MPRKGKNARKRLTVLVTEEMHRYVQEKAKICGSISEYIRHLILCDMNRMFSPPPQRAQRDGFHEKRGGAVASSEPRTRRTYVPMIGFGEHHAEIMRELKQVLAKRGKVE